MQIKFSRTMIAAAAAFAALFTARAWMMAQPQQGRADARGSHRSAGTGEI